MTAIVKTTCFLKILEGKQHNIAIFYVYIKKGNVFLEHFKLNGIKEIKFSSY